MEEQLITFEIAKLAKEKGFNITNRYSYDEITGLMLPLDPDGHGYALAGTCPASTQSLVQRWLREKYDIVVLVHRYDDNKKYSYLIDEEFIYEFGTMNSNYETYEEALEAGLQEALLLINT